VRTPTTRADANNAHLLLLHPAFLASQEKGMIKPIVAHAKQAIYTRSVQAAA
jgi:hypothetical protein